MSWIHALRARKSTVLAYSVVVLLAVIVIYAVRRPPVVMVAPVTVRPVAAEVEGDGTVTVDVLANIGARITGRVDHVFVNENDFVRKGQLIATFDATGLREQVQRARARVEAARAAAWQSRRAWGREQKLVVSGAVSREEADQYEERAQADASAVHAAEAELGYQEHELSEATVPSLVSGLVTKRSVEPGDAVVVGQPLVTVAETRVIYVAAHVDQRFSGQLREGQPATVILRGREGAPYRGRVYRISPQADPTAEETVVEVAFPLPPNELQIGQWAQVYITVGQATSAPVVPKSAVMAIGNDRFVFVVRKDGTVRRHAVQPVATSPRSAMVAVRGDLKPGEHVVIHPMGLMDGERVRIAKGPMTGTMPAMQ